MSNIGQAMGRMFGGDRASLREQLSALKQEHGTVTAAARALGIDRRTFQRWESGAIRHPRGANAEKVARGYREHQAKTRGPRSESDVTVSFTQRGKRGQERHRRVGGDRLALEPGTLDRARRAYIDGGSEAAGRAFVDGIGDDWYHDLFEDDLTGEGEHYDDSQSDPAPTSVSVS